MLGLRLIMQHTVWAPGSMKHRAHFAVNHHNWQPHKYFMFHLYTYVIVLSSKTRLDLNEFEWNHLYVKIFDKHVQTWLVLYLEQIKEVWYSIGTLHFLYEQKQKLYLLKQGTSNKSSQASNYWLQKSVLSVLQYIFSVFPRKSYPNSATFHPEICNFGRVSPSTTRAPF